MEREKMQRVRIGLTGLAIVFLLVLIAAAGLRPDRSIAPADGQGETLATLGVAPGPGADKATGDRQADQRAAPVAPAPVAPAPVAPKPI